MTLVLVRQAADKSSTLIELFVKIAVVAILAAVPFL
jgi:Tfp pilus assembly protein PilE